jgi:hypothetical protein
MDLLVSRDGAVLAQRENGDSTVRGAFVVPGTWNEEKRTLDVILVDERTSTERKRDWWTGKEIDEKIELDDSAVRLDRLNNGAPVLVAHRSRDAFAQIGKFVEGSARIEGVKPERQLVVTAAFSPNLSEDNERIVRDIAQGFRRHWSVGFWPHKTIVTEKGDGPNFHSVVDWTALEGSVVPIGADDGATTRSLDTPRTEGEKMPEEQTAEQKAAEQAKIDAEIQAQAKRLAEAAIAKRRDRDAKVLRLGKVLKFDRDKIDEYTARDEEWAVLSVEMTDAAAEAQKATGTDNTVRVEAGEYDERGIDDLRMASYLFVHRFGPDKAEEKFVESLQRREKSDQRHIATDITMKTLGQFEWSRESSQYLGRSLIDLARHCLERENPGCTKYMSPGRIATRALNTTSGFQLLLAEVLNASVDLGYTEVPMDARWAQRTVLRDFRNKHAITMGESAELLEIGEDGEFKTSTMREKEETYKLVTWGRSFAVSRELLVNDHLQGITDIPRKMGAAGVRKMRQILYGILTDGLTGSMSDGQPLFSTATGNRTFSNIAATNAIPIVENFNLARVAMATRPGLGNVDETLPTVQFPMRYLVLAEKWIDRVEQELGIAVQSSARADGAGITKQITSRLRGLQPIADPLMDAKDFGGGAGNGWVATDGQSVEYAFLEGAEGMQVNSYAPEGKLGNRIDAYMDFGAGAVETRGVQLNKGAAS